MSLRFGRANNPAMFVPSSVAKASKASLVGAKTVNVPLGSCKTTSRPS